MLHYMLALHYNAVVSPLRVGSLLVAHDTVVIEDISREPHTHRLSLVGLRTGYF